MPDMDDEQMAAPTDGARASDPVTERLTIGGRVVVRHRLPDGSEAGATDVIGTLISRDADTVVVERPGRGPVSIARDSVFAARNVPAPAVRRPPHEGVSIERLGHIMLAGWVPLEQAALGQWVARSAPGFTGRANSVLATGDPGLPLNEAIDWAERWYTSRDAVPLFQVSGPAGFAVEDLEIGAALLDRGYVVGGGHSNWDRVLVMTAASDAVEPLTETSPPVTADARLSPDWLITYGEQRSVVPGVTESVLTGSEGQLFLSIPDPDTRRMIAVARLSVHPRWAGISAVWVHPDHRRQGLARTLAQTVAMVGRENHMTSIYLQVSADNTDAVALYEGLGFSVHHEYTYLRAPEPPAAD